MIDGKNIRNIKGRVNTWNMGAEVAIVIPEAGKLGDEISLCKAFGDSDTQAFSDSRRSEWRSYDS